MKDHLLEELRWIRSVLTRKVDGLSEYDARRPLTPPGTNLLGLVKQVAWWESRYFGEVFGRPCTGVPPWTDAKADRAALWVAPDETRAWILDLYADVARHSDTTIPALPLDAPGQVPWWPRPEVGLLGVLVHVVTETTRHAGHGDILREQLDGSVGDEVSPPPHDGAYGEAHWSRVEDAARVAGDGGQDASSADG